MSIVSAHWVCRHPAADILNWCETPSVSIAIKTANKLLKVCYRLTTLHTTNYETTQRLSIVFAYEIDASPALPCMRSRKHEFSFMGKIVLLYWTGIGHISWFTVSNTCVVSSVSVDECVRCVRSEEKQNPLLKFYYALCPMQACDCLPPRVLVSAQEQTSSRASWCIKIQFVFFLRVVVAIFFFFLLFFLVHDFCAHWIYCMCALLLQATRFNINNL